MSEHGTRTKYVAGCRCDACRQANRDYARERDRHMRRVAYGIEKRNEATVDATEARNHLLWLQSLGIGTRTVAQRTGLSRSALCKIRNGETDKVLVDTEQRIMCLFRDTRQPLMLVDATRTWRLVGWLQQQGWSNASIARALGYRTRAIQFRRDRVRYRTEQRVEQLVRKVLSDAR